MTTPRRTRLVRVRDLHAFRHAISALWTAYTQHEPSATLVIVPTQGAGNQLARTLERAQFPLIWEGHADLVTRDQLYDRLHARLSHAPRRLTLFEREAIAQAAARDASIEPYADSGVTPDASRGGDPAGVPAGPEVGSSRVDLQACKLEYSIVSPK